MDGMTKKLFSPVRLLVLAAAIVAVLSVWTWWQYVYTSSDRTFWGMMGRNLMTNAYGKVIDQSEPGDQVRQASVIDYASQQRVNGQTLLNRGSGDQYTHVITDTVGTPGADYVRYPSIQTGQKDADGKPLDFSQVEGVWGVADSGSPTGGQLFGDMALGIVPVAQLNADQRSAVIGSIRSTKAYSINSVKQQTTNIFGRKAYTYDVTVHVRGYVTALKQLASVTGMKNLEAIDPMTYSEDREAKLLITVDSWSRQVTKVEYPDSGRVEEFAGLGTTQRLHGVPDKTITVDELQQRLGQVR